MRVSIIFLFLLSACATKPPVVIVCEPPDSKLVVPLMFPEVENLGELEDALVEFVHRTLPADNARKDEILRQLEKLKPKPK